MGSTYFSNRFYFPSVFQISKAAWSRNDPVSRKSEQKTCTNHERKFEHDEGKGNVFYLRVPCRLFVSRRSIGGDPRNAIRRFTWTVRLSIRLSSREQPASAFRLSTLIDGRIGSIATEAIARVFVRCARLELAASGGERRLIRHNYVPSARVLPPPY